MKVLADNINRYENEQKRLKYKTLLEAKWGEAYRRYRSNWDEARQLVLKTDFPMHIDMDTVDACNLHCLYCSEEHGYIRKRTLKKIPGSIVDALFREAARPAGKDRLCAVNIGTLGEPLLYPEMVFKILEGCNKAGVMETFLHTNGHLLTVDIFKKMAGMGLTHLFFSVDAIRPDTYKRVRGGDLSVATKNILDVVEYKKAANGVFPVIRVSFLENKYTSPEKNEFVEFWKDKVDFIDIQGTVDFTVQLSETDKIRSSCILPFQRITIGVQGEIGPCCAGYIMVPGFYLGIIPDMSVYEAWNSERANALRAAHKDMSLEYFPMCWECLARRSWD
ncbi:MAG: hypothetical protein A2879_03920 [Omnitrophica WOR_2 bacterium RIFCSPHIGHO2_01_FULL_49_10]|nr:MAG: hypothetical protein A2879_03920 [Omnitrophica WOR_2 bacterium RIFCSPHIGHO2_01_FULL_49_10]